MNHTKSYIKNYPRPSFVRDDYLLLNGIWNFKFDDSNVGVKKKWFNKILEDSRHINVPFSYHTKASLIEELDYHEVLWYQKEIEIPKDKLNKETIIHFDGIDYEMDLWVNGIYIGNAKGAYHRHSFNITFAAKEKNLIVVRTYDDFSTANPRGKQRWKHQNYGCWYVETSGIWKSVWIEFAHEHRLENVIMKPNIHNQSLDLVYSFDKMCDNLFIETKVSFNDKLIYFGKEAILRNNFKSTIDVRAIDDQFKIFYWDDKNPNLYDIEFNVYLNNKLIDNVKSYFAMREWKASGKDIYLNYDKRYLKMVLDQGYDLEMGLSHLKEESIEKDIKLILDLGFNGVRKHQVIADERFYYLCDVYGLYVWLEMPSAYEFNQEMTLKVTNEWMQILKQYQRYPSIMTYVIFNESWGVHHVKYKKEEQALCDSLYYLTKSIDDTRFVIANDGWEHTLTDIVTIHNYTQKKNEMLEGYRNVIQDLINNTVPYAPLRAVFAEGYKYQGQPIIISEYAGIAIKEDNGWGYGDKVKDKQEFINRYEELTDAIKENKDITGYCATQLTDVEQETNGFLYPNREQKVSIEEIKRINDK